MRTRPERIIRHLSGPEKILRTFSGVVQPARALLFSRGAILRQLRGHDQSIDRSLFLSANSSPFRKNICLGIAFAPPTATTGPNGEQFLESERTDASRRFLPHRQIIAFDFSLRFLPPCGSPSLPTLSLSLFETFLRAPPALFISFPSESPRDRRSLPSYIITLFPNNWPIYTRVPAENNPPLSLSVSRAISVSLVPSPPRARGVCPIGLRRAVILCIWECD